MVPPRVKKTPSRTNITQGTTRRSAQPSHKKVINEVKDFDKLSDMDTCASDSDTKQTEPEASPSTSDGAFEQLTVKIVADQRKRLTDQKQDISKEYNARRAVIEQSITMAFDEHEDQVNSAHQAQLQRLQDLLAQKASIEAAMARQLVSLQKIYDAHSRDLEAVVDRRRKEMMK